METSGWQEVDLDDVADDEYRRDTPILDWELREPHDGSAFQAVLPFRLGHFVVYRATPGETRYMFFPGILLEKRRFYLKLPVDSSGLITIQRRPPTEWEMSINIQAVMDELGHKGCFTLRWRTSFWRSLKCVFGAHSWRPTARLDQARQRRRCSSCSAVQERTIAEE